MFGVLISLGLWQLHRLTWKRAVLSSIDRAQLAAPIPMPNHPGRFQKVVVAGVFVEHLSVLYGADVRDTPQGPVLGAQLIQPMILPSGQPLLVDRGWVPEGWSNLVQPLNHIVNLDGYLREPERPSFFSPKDDVGHGRFYTLNPAAIGSALHLSNVAPFTLIALGPAGVTPPIPATTLPHPPNDHLNYAITWFSLAAVLAAVFCMWLRKTLRS